MIEVRQTTVFAEWFDDLKDGRARDRIAIRIRRIEMGNLGDAKPVGGAVSEMRIDYGPGYRVYFTQRGRTIVILLCGGDKSTQSRDIRKAQELAAQLE